MIKFSSFSTLFSSVGYFESSTIVNCWAYTVCWLWSLCRCQVWYWLKCLVSDVPRVWPVHKIFLLSVPVWSAELLWFLRLNPICQCHYHCHVQGWVLASHTQFQHLGTGKKLSYAKKRSLPNVVRLSVSKSVPRTTFDVCDNSRDTEPSYAEFT